MYKPLSIALIVFLTLAFSSQVFPASPTAKKKTQTLTKVAGNPDAPNFRLEDQDGNFVQLSDFAGKVVIVNFWATWCPPCRESVPHLMQTYRKYKDRGFEVVGISLDTNFDDLKSYAEDKNLSYKIVVGNQQTKVDYGVSSIPRMFIIDKEGIIRGDFLGFSKGIGDEMAEKIETLLTQ